MLQFGSQSILDVTIWWARFQFAGQAYQINYGHPWSFGKQPAFVGIPARAYGLGPFTLLYMA